LTAQMLNLQFDEMCLSCDCKAYHQKVKCN
jgi:hypothetical protein